MRLPLALLGSVALAGCAALPPAIPAPAAIQPTATARVIVARALPPASSRAGVLIALTGTVAAGDAAQGQELVVQTVDGRLFAWVAHGRSAAAGDMVEFKDGQGAEPLGLH